MARLPQPGADNGTWGDILNEYLSQSLSTDGALKSDIVGAAQLKDNSVTNAAIAPNTITNTEIATDAVNATSIADGSITNSLIADGTIQETKLSAPLQTKLNQAATVSSVNNKTGSVTLDKNDIGLGNVDNTSDVYKNAAAVTLTNKTLTDPIINLIKDTNSNIILNLNAATSAVNYIKISNSASANTPSINASGNDTNVSIDIAPKGSGSIVLRDGSNFQIASFSGVSSPVNRITFTNSVTGTGPSITATGSDTDVGLNIYSKGAGGVLFRSNTNGTILRAFGQANGVNYLDVYNGVANNPPTLRAAGSDTNIGINLVPKGTGVVQANGVEVVTLSNSQTLTNKTLTNPRVNSLRDTASGTVALAMGAAANAVNYIYAYGDNTGAPPQLAVFGSDTDIDLMLVPKGAGRLRLYATTGNTPTINAYGPDNNINLNITTKGNGVLQANGVEVSTVSSTQTLTNKTLTAPRVDQLNDTNGNTILKLNSAASAVNYISLYNSAIGSSPVFAALGADANLSVYFMPKGTGGLAISVPSGQSSATIIGTGVDANTNINLVPKGTGVVQANYVEVATISGTQTLTNKTISGLVNTITNIGSSALANNAVTTAKIADGSVTAAKMVATDWATKANATTANSGQMLSKGVIQTQPESNNFSNILYFLNDIAYNLLRGGSAIFQRNGITETQDLTNAFTPDANYKSFTFSTSDVFTIEVTLCKTMTYSTWYGIAFAESFRAQNVTIELYDSVAAQWITSATRTNDSTGVFWVNASAGNGGANPVSKLRYTFSNFNSYNTTLRITSIFAITYNSGLLTETFMPRGGGSLYGSNAAPPTLSAAGSDTNIDLLLASKGTGLVKANGNQVATIVGVPATATSPGLPGQIAYNANYIYVCIATNTWVRSAAGSW